MTERERLIRAWIATHHNPIYQMPAVWRRIAREQAERAITEHSSNEENNP